MNGPNKLIKCEDINLKDLRERREFQEETNNSTSNNCNDFEFDEIKKLRKEINELKQKNIDLLKTQVEDKIHNTRSVLNKI